MINVKLRTEPKWSFGSFKVTVTNIIVGDEGVYVVGHHDTDIVDVYSLHLSTFSPFIRYKLAKYDVNYTYDNDERNWELVSSSDEDKGDKVIRVQRFSKPIKDVKLSLDNYNFLIHDNQIGANVIMFNDDVQEDRFLTYLHSWLTLDYPEGYVNPFPIGKELDKELSSVHLNTGLQLRLRGIGSPRLVGEKAGELDDDDTVNHFTLILSSI